MLLLGSCGRSGSCLNLGMLLGHQRRMLLLVWVMLGGLVLLVLLLLVQPRRISLRVLMLMRKNVLSLRLKHDESKNRR